ncbi:MAG: GDSL-type esterase/lipase family protein [Monoglobales bacterium]
MIYNNILFHNVDELRPTSNGVKICRFKENVQKHINERGRRIANFCCGSELRFVTDAKNIHITFLTKLGGGVTGFGTSTVTIYCGDYYHTIKEIPDGVLTTIAFELTESLMNMPDEFFEGNVFSKNVWRIHLANGSFEFCGIDTYGLDIRPPREDEMPKTTILSYGSSISHGCSSVANTQSYVNTFARLMKADVLIKGIAGSCWAEKEIADDFATRDDWDIALMEIGINMLGTFEPEEFKNRFCYFADALYKTGKKLIFMTVPRYYAYYEKDALNGKRLPEYNRIIREKCNQFESDRVILLEGTELVKETSYLMSERLHPSTHGQIDMGYNLYNSVKDRIK